MTLERGYKPEEKNERVDSKPLMTWKQKSEHSQKADLLVEEPHKPPDELGQQGTALGRVVGAIVQMDWVCCDRCDGTNLSITVSVTLSVRVSDGMSTEGFWPFSFFGSITTTPARSRTSSRHDVAPSSVP